MKSLKISKTGNINLEINQMKIKFIQSLFRTYHVTVKQKNDILAKTSCLFTNLFPCVLK